MSINKQLICDEMTMDINELSPLSVSCAYSESHFDEYDDLTRRERILLRPWLENLVDSGQVPGLEWIDRGKYVFKVPWKHRSKKSWSVEHSSVFLEWAKNTGRWREGDPEPNYAQLKTRLRCAFNKAPDIQEIKELHKTKCEDAYKVYRFVPKKDSRFGNSKKKMLIPTSVKRRHCPWVNSLRLQGKRLKQEDILEPVSQVKMEPLCSSSDGYYESESAMTSAPYQGGNYRYGHNGSSTMNHPSSPRGSVSTPRPELRDVSDAECRYVTKYQMKQQMSGDYPEGDRPIGDRVQLQAFPEIVSELSRRSDNIDDTTVHHEGTHKDVDGYEICKSICKEVVLHPPHNSKFPNNEMSNNHTNMYNHRSIRQTFHDTEYHHAIQTTFSDASDSVHHRKQTASYLEENRRVAMKSVMHQDFSSAQPLKFQELPGCSKFYPVDDHIIQQMYRQDIPQRMDQERFNIMNNGQNSHSPSDYDNRFRRHMDLHPSHPIRSTDLTSENKHPSLDSCTSRLANGFPEGSSDLPVPGSIPNVSLANNFYTRRPPLEPLMCKSTELVNNTDNCNSRYRDKDDLKIAESCSSIPDSNKMTHYQENIDMKEKICQDQMSLVSSYRPVGQKVLDLTKKVKMAVAPIMAHRPQQSQSSQQSSQSSQSSQQSQHNDAGRSTSKLTNQSYIDKFNEYLNNPSASSNKFLDLIEWEKRLIERERELLARERLMTIKEKNLRELELAYQLNRKSDTPNRRPYFIEDMRRSEKMSFNPPKRETIKCLDFNKITYSSPSSPPPLSPLRGNSCVDRIDPRWSREFLEGDASSASESSQDSDVYYSQLFVPSNIEYSNGEVAVKHSGTYSTKSQNNALFINNAKDEHCAAIVHRQCLDGGAYTRPKNKDQYGSCSPSRVDEEVVMYENPPREAEKSDEEFVKVLPVVDSLNSEEVLHIAKLPEKISEDKKGAESGDEGDAPYTSLKNPASSLDAEKASTSRSDDFHEEVWKRRMKWMSFQNSSQLKVTASHWIWPNIGNLGNQQQDHNKLGDGN